MSTCNCSLMNMLHDSNRFLTNVVQRIQTAGNFCKVVINETLRIFVLCVMKSNHFPLIFLLSRLPPSCNMFMAQHGCNHFKLCMSVSGSGFVYHSHPRSKMQFLNPDMTLIFLISGLLVHNSETHQNLRPIESRVCTLCHINYNLCVFCIVYMDRRLTIDTSSPPSLLVLSTCSSVS